MSESLPFDDVSFDDLIRESSQALSWFLPRGADGRGLGRTGGCGHKLSSLASQKANREGVTSVSIEKTKQNKTTTLAFQFT